YHHLDSVSIRAVPSLPLVTLACRVLPRTFHRATCSPFLSTISAPAGNALVICFLKMLPIVLPLEKSDRSGRGLTGDFNCPVHPTGSPAIAQAWLEHTADRGRPPPPGRG